MRGTPGTGTARVVTPWLASGAGSGTATVIAPAAAGAGTGTATVNRALANGAAKRECYGSARVTVEGEIMSQLVGSVSIEQSLDSPVPVASFELASERLARHHPDTLTWGQKDVTIDLRTGSPGYVEEWEAFVGRTDASSNAGAYCPRGSIRALARASGWVGKLGCIRVNAFSGKRRGRILHEFATSLGVTIANPEIDSLGAIVSRPIEWNGISLLDAANRFAEIEGWFVRINAANEMEIILESQVLTGPSMYDFTPDRYYSLPETPPSRPVTNWVLSGAYIPDSLKVLSGYTSDCSTVYGADDAGATETRTWIIRDRGVEIWRRVDEWRVFVRDGVTALPATFLLTKRTETTSTWALALFGDGLYHYTTQLTGRVTNVWELGGILADNTHSLWTDGSYYLAANAAWVSSQQDTEAFAWWPATGAPLPHMACTQRYATLLTKRWYSPIQDAAVNLYADGKNHAETSYQWYSTDQESTRWIDRRDAEPQEVWAVTVVSGYEYISASAADVWRVKEKIVEIWTGLGAGDKHTHSIRTNGKLVSIETVDGPVPGPPVGSVNVAQIQQVIAVDSFDASSFLPFDTIKASEVLENIESPEEFEAVRNRRYRWALADTVEVRSPIVPHVDLADVVRVTDAARSLALKRGMVVSQKLLQELVQSGKGEETMTVKLLPDWP